MVSAWRFHEHGVTLTLVASSEEIAALDGLQYLRGGPCVEAVASEKVWAYVNNADPLDEDRCRLFVRGTAAVSIASTLSIPIVVDRVVTGSVNLSAASPRRSTVTTRASLAFSTHGRPVR